MKLIAFAGSSSQNSINKQLVKYAQYQFVEFETEFLDINDYEAPLYSIDRENENGIPDYIEAFAKKIDEADLVLVSLAEHNGNITAAFKNLYDWVSRIIDRKVFNETPVFLMSTSPGGRGGASVMEIMSNRIPRDGAVLVETFSLPRFKDNFEDGAISNAELNEEFLAKVEKVKAFCLE